MESIDFWSSTLCNASPTSLNVASEDFTTSGFFEYGHFTKPSLFSASRLELEFLNAKI